MRAAALLATAACFTASPALAQIALQGEEPAEERRSVERRYDDVYGSLGFSYINDDDLGLGAITARAGWELDERFAVEGELSYGLFDDDNVGLGVTFGAFGVVRKPVNEVLTLFARGGLYRIEFDVDTPGGDAGPDDIAPAFGGGAVLNLDYQNAVRFGLTFADVADNSVELIEASYVRRF